MFFSGLGKNVINLSDNSSVLQRAEFLVKSAMMVFYELVNEYFTFESIIATPFFYKSLYLTLLSSRIVKIKLAFTF